MFRKQKISSYWLILAVVLMLVISTLSISNAQDTADPIVISADNVNLVRQFDSLEQHGSSVISLAFSPDGNTLASSSYDNTAILWDMESLEPRFTLENHTNRVYQIAFSPDGSQVATASRDRTVRLWDVESGQELSLIEGHEGDVISVIFSPDGSHIVTGSYDRTVRVWDSETGQPIAIYDDLSENSDSLALSLAFSPDGETLAIGIGNVGGYYDSADSTIEVRLVDIATGDVLEDLAGHTSAVWAVAYNQSGTRLASASNDSTVQVWNLETGELAAVLEGHDNTLHRGLAFSPDETLIATGSFDKTLRFWDAETGVERASIASGNDFIESLAFSPNGDIVATGTLLGQIRLWAVDLNAEPEEMVNAADANAEPVNTTGDESSEPEPATITMIDQGAIVVGQTVIGVTNSTQHRTLTFTATERQTITINNNSFSIFVEVLDADGNVIVERTDVARIGPITFDDGGDYTILLSTNSTGQFSIRITE